MSAGPLALYRGAPLGARVHVRGRWLTCPFPRIERAVPAYGRVLEVGCGYGLFSTYLALREPGREVVGVDIDQAKIEVATAVAGGIGGGAGRRVVSRPAFGGRPPASRLGGITKVLVGGRSAASARRAEPERHQPPRCQFELAPSGHVPPGPWDAVAIVDVLYLLEEADQKSLVETCAAALAPGGALVLKEMGTAPAWKARWNKAQETVSVRALKITAGDRLTFVAPEEMGRWMNEAGLSVSHHPIGRRYPHPHHLIVGRRPPGEGATGG
ncbi:MAG: class I SAM-dependent methyltransferase [Actinomycetota bacterium]